MLRTESIILKFLPNFPVDIYGNCYEKFTEYCKEHEELTEDEAVSLLKKKLDSISSVNASVKTAVNTTVSHEAITSNGNVAGNAAGAVDKLRNFTPLVKAIEYLRNDYSDEKYCSIFRSFENVVKSLKTMPDLNDLRSCLEIALRHNVHFEKNGLCLMTRGGSVFPYTTVALQKTLIRKQTGNILQGKVLMKSEVAFIKEEAAEGNVKYSDLVLTDPDSCVPFHKIADDTLLKNADTVLVWQITSDCKAACVKSYKAADIMARVGIKIDEKGVVLKKSSNGHYYPDNGVWGGKRSHTDGQEMLKTRAYSWYLKDYNTLDAECEAMEQQTFDRGVA